MKKVLVLILCAMLVFCGCDVDISVQMPESQAMRCADLMEQLMDVAKISCDKTECYGEQNFGVYFEYWFDMPMNFVSDGAISYVNAGNNADEICILYPESGVTYQTVKEALERRPEKQKKRLTGLHDEQALRYEDAVLAECEGFLLLVVCENADAVAAEFEQILGGNP